MEYTAADGKTYKTKFYNLDAILSVGYRVNSVNATRFRKWANNVSMHYMQRYVDEAVSRHNNREKKSGESFVTLMEMR